MRKWIALALSAILLMGILSGCKKEELDLTPDDQMTIAICALARSVKAQKDATRPTQYTVKSLRTLDGVKTMETTSSYNIETAFSVVETRYFDGENETGSEINYIFTVSHLGGDEERFEIVSATEKTVNGNTTKEYTILHTAETPEEIANAWEAGKYGADMTYQTYGRLEDLILSAAMSQGGAVAKVTSANDFTLTITDERKTETYTVEDDRITQFIWTENTANGEDENTWNYYWDVADVTLPNYLEGWTLVTE